MKANLFGIVDRHMEKASQVVNFSLHVGVVEILIAFAATPENIVLTAKLLGYFKALLRLDYTISKDVGIATCRSTVHKSRIAEEIGRAPKEFNPSLLLVLFERLGDSIKIGV